MRHSQRSFYGLLFFLLLQINAFTQSKVLHVSLKSEIDPRAERYILLAFEKAKTEKFDAVALELNTYGGTVDNADAIVKIILDTKIPVFAFVNNNAASAGAWIAIACDKIYMVDGATIGAATVVNQKGEKMPDKYQSYMRGKMRATAEKKNRNPDIAEAMVDESISISGLIDNTKVLTFTTNEAIKNNYCDGTYTSIQQALNKNNLRGVKITHYELNWIERVIAFFLNPYISGILLLIIFGGIYFELQTPGIGFPLIASVIGITLYFVPYYFHDLAESWELILFFIGILLLGLEFFVIPGFTIAGILGIITTLFSAFLMMVNNDGFTFDFVNLKVFYGAMTTVIMGFLGAIGLIIFALPKVLRSPLFKKRISLEKSMKSEEGYTSNTYEIDMVGSYGVTHTVLRPSGKIEVNNELYDASTRGDFLEKGVKIVIISLDGGSYKVKETK